jgi:hypothetical protein
MSFLSRRPSRSGNREGDAGRDDEYDDYDYAPDGYRADEDENWSPGEYFSPEGIKGRWADGQRPGERPAARGRRGDSGRGDMGRGDSGRGDMGRGDVGRGDPGRGDPARGDSGQGYQDRTGGGYDDDGYNGHGPGGYGTDEYATGAYDLPEGADEERGERGGRRRKERGERGSRLRIGRRDRGEEIWPDDGVSDEDYWASVASDRPLSGGNPALEADLPLPADSRPKGRPVGRGSNDDMRAATGPRPGTAPRAAGDQRFGDDQRGGTGRLGPPPGLVGDYQPGGGVGSSGGASPGGVNSGRAGSGPMAGYAPTGGARPGTGPMAVRPGTGPISAWSSQAGYASPSATGPRPSFQPGSGSAAGRVTGGRPAAADRAADWGERTERIDRVNAAGYPEPRANGRGQSPGRPGGSAAGAASDPFGAAAAPGTPGRGRVDNSRADNGRLDNGRIDGPDWRTKDRREQGRDANREPSRASGGWPAAGRGGLSGADRAGDRPGADDPLTSTAYSRASDGDSDGRSYRVAARRSQAQAKLTEQTQIFSAPTGHSSDQNRTGPYETGLTGEYPARPYGTGAAAAPGGQRGGQYQTGATGEYPTSQHRSAGVSGVPGKSAADQYRTGDYPTGDYRGGEYQTGEYGQHRPDAQPSDARYPGYSGSQPGPSGLPGSAVGSGQPGQPSRRGQQAPAGPGGLNTASGPNRFGGQPTGSQGRASQPNAIGAPSGQYPAQEPRHRHQRPQAQPPQSQPAQSHAPQSQPPRQPVQPQLPTSGGQGANGQGGGSPTGGAPSRSLPASTGRNPYESAVTGSYPYPSQPYPARPGPSANRTSDANPALDGRDGRDGRYYRPGQAQPDGHDPDNDGYGAPRDRRY